MLSGISRKRSIRSNPYWFTEFCNSQCLSHFAAPFIVVRAETSVAESCKASGVERTTREDTSQSTNAKFKIPTAGQERGYDGPLPPHTLPASPCTGASISNTNHTDNVDVRMSASPSPPRASPRFVHMVWLDACE